MKVCANVAFAEGTYLEAISSYEKLVGSFYESDQIQEAKVYEQKVIDMKQSIDEREIYQGRLEILSRDPRVIWSPRPDCAL